MWNKPWTMKEGFLIGGGLIVIGLILELCVGPVVWETFAWPINGIVLGIFVTIIAVMHLLRAKFYAFRFLSTYQAAIPVMCDSTYRGRINKALDYVKRMYPTKQIVLLTPIHRAEFYANEKNWQPREDYTNKCGEYIDAYVQSVKEAGTLWAVPVIDLNALCGLYPLMDEYAQYFHNADNDRLHPNDEGHRRMAQVLMYQLLSIPLF